MKITLIRIIRHRSREEMIINGRSKLECNRARKAMPGCAIICNCGRINLIKRITMVSSSRRVVDQDNRNYMVRAKWSSAMNPAQSHSKLSSKALMNINIFHIKITMLSRTAV